MMKARMKLKKHMDSRCRHLLLMGGLCLGLASASAQTFTQTFKNAPLEKVIKDIERQTHMSLIYEIAEVDVNQKVTGTFSNTPLREVLEKVLGNTHHFEINNKIIIIRKKKNQKEHEKTQQPTQKTTPKVTQKVSGKVVDESGEPLIGVSVWIEDIGQGAITDANGCYNIESTKKISSLRFSYIGYITQDIATDGRPTVDVMMREETNQVLQEVVVTAMGIQRKEKSLTYATQQIKADDLTRVQSTDAANALEGKVSGLTVTTNAGGAGGASRIVLRGNKSIMGNSTPLIVVDGIPMANTTRNQMNMNDGGKLTYSGISEGADPLSLINPDDIASINVLKGANAAALYGSVAANGVIMITTKKGKEGRLDINFSTGITLESPLCTPDIQNTYGATVDAQGVSTSSWGDKVAARNHSDMEVSTFTDSKFGGMSHTVRLRNQAKDDIHDFYQLGYTTNNSISLAGGTNKMRTYFSYSNAYSQGLVKNNTYNRNIFALRQSYNLIDRLHIDLSLNYTHAVTKNRLGGGTVLNPIYHLYTMPRNIALDYYREHYSRDNGQWISEPRSLYVPNEQGGYSLVTENVHLKGQQQEWTFLMNGQNNPYWLTNVNNSKQQENIIKGMVTGTWEVCQGLSMQARYSFDHNQYYKNSYRHATTFLPNSMDDFGHYWKDIYKTTEMYSDILLSYNKDWGRQWTTSATAGWVGHVMTGEVQKTDVEATYISPKSQMLSNRINLFMTNAGGTGATSTVKMSNWDKAMLFTGQVGWKETVYFDVSYRRDWYRAFKQFSRRGTPDNYGYWGVGANAILSGLMKLPKWVNYLKYRMSYSEVGNSIPNIVYAKGEENLENGSVTLSPFSRFANPKPEKTKSLEMGCETYLLDNALNIDLTYYNTTMQNLYMLATNASQKAEPVNSGKVRNQGFELTVGYNILNRKNLIWKTVYNLSYNHNKILETAHEKDGSEKRIYQDIGGVRVRYTCGGSIGDMYVTDFKRNADGTYILTNDGKPQLETEVNKQYGKFIGNMNANWQTGWSNHITYKNFNLSFLINGRIGGKVISLTEAYLDNLGLSQRSANARLNAERSGIIAAQYDNAPGMALDDGSNRIVPIKAYYESIGGNPIPSQYVYNATNFRLRELSVGYTFKHLMGKDRHLSMSLVARNLFFIYNSSPIDPDTSLSTQNGLGAFELFNLPSTRSLGLSIKLNY